jgi:hypothetical protein
VRKKRIQKTQKAGKYIIEYLPPELGTADVII